MNRNREETITDIISGLTYLIVNHASHAAREQYAPSLNSDESDEHIKEHKEWVKKLRAIREDFENTVTGLLP